MRPVTIDFEKWKLLHHGKNKIIRSQAKWPRSEMSSIMQLFWYSSKIYSVLCNYDYTSLFSSFAGLFWHQFNTENNTCCWRKRNYGIDNYCVVEHNIQNNYATLLMLPRFIHLIRLECSPKVLWTIIIVKAFI